MKKLLVLALLLPLLLVLPTACGGGGGGGVPAPNPGPDPDPDPTDAERAEEILEACVVAQLDTALAVGELLRDVLNGSSTGFRIVNAVIEQDSFVIDCEVELAGGQPPEATSNFTMFDAQGAPANPVGDNQNPLWQNLGNGINELAGILQQAGVPDGLQLVMDYVGNEVLVANGQVGVGYAGNQPSTTTGNLVVTDLVCASTFEWSNVPLADFPVGGIPTAAFTVNLQSASDQLLGTLTLDGTTTAAVSVALNGGSTLDFTLDLDTGAATLL